jgi:hypothetical protein
MDGFGDTGIDLHWHGCGSIPSHSLWQIATGRNYFIANLLLHICV